MTKEQVEEPLTLHEIELRKMRFVAELDIPIDRATCHTCGAMKANRCSLQYDTYNTDGDCLASK